MLLLNLFLNIYTNSALEGDKGGFFSEAPDWKHLFLLKTEIKQNPGWPNEECNAIIEHIYRNIRTYLRSKKISIDQYWENIIAYWDPSKAKSKSKVKCGLFQIKLCGLGGTTMRKILQFSPSFKPGKFVILRSLICCTNMKIYFSWKLAI